MIKLHEIIDLTVKIITTKTISKWVEDPDAEDGGTYAEVTFTLKEPQLSVSGRLKLDYDNDELKTGNLIRDDQGINYRVTSTSDGIAEVITLSSSEKLSSPHRFHIPRDFAVIYKPFHEGCHSN
jgi:hypothetical protein